MRGEYGFEAKAEGECVRLTRYRVRYGKGGDERVPEMSALCAQSELAALFDRFLVPLWNGFRGPHPPDVRDGLQFSLEAELENGRRVRASGSENFPPAFSGFERGLDELLKAGSESADR